MVIEKINKILRKLEYRQNNFGNYICSNEEKQAINEVIDILENNEKFYISFEKIDKIIKNLEDEKRFYYSNYKLEKIDNQIEILKKIKER